MSTVSDQKKRTLEAIEQRYAAAKAKKLQDEQPKYQKSKDTTPKPKFDARRKGKTPEFTPSRTSTLKAQANSSYKHKPSASADGEVHPIYSELAVVLHENLSQHDQDGFSDLDSTDVVHSVVYDIIQKGGEAGKISKGSKKLKLDKGILLDNYVQRGPTLVDAQSQSLLIHSKRSKRHMSLKQHKKCGSFDLHDTFHSHQRGDYGGDNMHLLDAAVCISCGPEDEPTVAVAAGTSMSSWPAETDARPFRCSCDVTRGPFRCFSCNPRCNCRFDLYKPMHEMWKEYIQELTKSTPKKKLSEYLLSADLHGALIIVAQCKAASYQGVSGIMIRDTAETFGIISEDNRFQVVPKHGSVFVLQADCWKVTLIGDKLSPKEKLKESQRLQRAESLIR
ncbi:unnamed protein product [Alopecurus aequalis]